MLLKTAVKECIAGKPTPVVPAFLFWFDAQFVRQNAVEVARMRESYENDFVMTRGTLVTRKPVIELEPDEFMDDWGSRFKASPDGVGPHPSQPIVSTLEEWEQYVAAVMPLIERDVFNRDIIAAVKGHRDYYVVATLWRTFYERMYMLIGFEPLMVEMLMASPLFQRLLSVLRDFTIDGIECIADAGADAVYLADDWGGQGRLQISPESWRTYFKPAYGAMVEAAHARGLDVWMRSCGQITEIIPDWIDIGLDVISQLEPSALDLPAVAREFGGKIAFFGGIDVQFNLVNGTRDSIREEIRNLMEHFRAHEGGYMAGPCKTIRPETPVENMWTLLEALREFGCAS
ncbi:MAG: hypothetical protein GWP08_21880 [Nitrospiraceae bacterium]|nr:hypothetical protein [Nitrospiraceae bacterium]